MNARHLRAARALAELTQQQLAAEAGLHVNSVKYWETQSDEIGGHAVDRILSALDRHGIALAEERRKGGTHIVLRAPT